MKILSLGLDNSVLNKTSVLAARVIEYGSLIKKYDVVVPNVRNERVELSAKTAIYGSGGGNKLTQLIKIYGLVKKLLQAGSYDVITVQDAYYLALIGWWLARKFEVGLEVQVHGFEKLSGLRKLIAKHVLPQADAVRCVSQRLKKQLVSQFDVSEEKITVVSIFTEKERNAIKTRRSAGKFIFLTVGRLVPVKNIGLQIKAMAEVAQKYPKAELWIIGDGPERKLYQSGKNVRLFGWQNDLAEYYSQVDAFMLTSNYEGWGLVVIEAASHGLPIIMTDVGCAGEVIKNNESGLVIPIGNKQKLIEAMLKLMADAGLREKLASGAKLAISQLPSKEQTLTLYKKSWERAMKHN